MTPFDFHLPPALTLGPLEFGQPMWLLGLLLLAPIYYLWKSSRVPGSPIRKWVSLALRCALIMAIVLSLADTRITWFNRGICVVFVIDQSQSVPGPAREIVRERIQAEVAKMTKDDRFVIVEFGGDAVLGSLPSPRGSVPPPAKVSEPGKTDIARALRLAIASFPEDRQKRIVLFSDGNQNSGDALREARIAGVKDIDIDVLLLSAQRGHEVMVDQLIVPQQVRKDAHFSVRAIVTSDTAQAATLLVTRDGVPMQQMETQLKAGTNVLDIPDSLADGGYHEYQVTVQPQNPDSDTFAANNTGYAFTQVDAPGKVLLIRGRPDDPPFLYDALQASHVPVISRGVSGLPASVTDLAPYDCVILENIGVEYLAQAQMTELAKWVKDYGGGLILVGGDNSFGPGGYKNTPIEAVAPVDMDVKREKHLASLAIVVVLDKSGSMGAPAKGSMGANKLDLANKGAIEVVNLLDPTDSAMVGAVDTQVKWMLEPRVIPMSAGNKARLKSATAMNVVGGGGILCETALVHAYQVVNAPTVDAMSKHVIMFADLCDSEQQDNCVAMADRNFRQFGVTTTCIGLGTLHDPDAAFQEAVAKAGHGRFFATDDAMALPKLFAKEAFLVSRKAFVEKKEGIPPTMYTSPILEGFLDVGVPKVYGYVGSTLKPRATLAMHGAEPDDPLLAHWVIGLGKCVAYTSDTTGNWGKDWVSWNGYSKFWSQVVRWVSKTAANNGVTTATVIEGSDGRVVVDAVDSAGHPINNLQLKANVIVPDQMASTKELQLEQIAPGRYQGRFTASERGTYLVSVADARTEAPLATGGGVLSYPAEYRDLQANAPLLRAVTEATAGQYLSNIDGVFQQKPNPVQTFWPLFQVLMVVVTSMLLLDVAWRRLNIADWFRRHVPQGMPVVARTDAAVGALRSIRSGRRDVDTQRKSLRDRIESRAAEELTVAPLPGESGTAAGGGLVGEVGSAPTSKPEGGEGAGENYANRLMSAKKRAKEQIHRQSEEPK